MLRRQQLHEIFPQHDCEYWQGSHVEKDVEGGVVEDPVLLSLEVIVEVDQGVYVKRALPINRIMLKNV